MLFHERSYVIEFQLSVPTTERRERDRLNADILVDAGKRRQTRVDVIELRRPSPMLFGGEVQNQLVRRPVQMERADLQLTLLANILILLEHLWIYLLEG